MSWGVKDFFICFSRIGEAGELQNILEQNGYSTSVFSDALKMLEIFSTEGCGAFIVDSGLKQGATCNKAIAIIKNLSPDIPIIVCSDEDSLETEREARSQDIFFYYVRPIPEDELLQLAHDASRKK